MEKFFKLSEHGTTVRTEVLAGLTTFFAMSYILFVNPQMLSQTGMPAQGVFLATIIGSVVGTLMMAFYANLPYAQAPGMGLNAFFTFTVVFGMGYTWQEALGMVFICGVISLIITLTKVRKMIIESIPTALRSAISAGIGIFLAYVGIKNAGFLKFTIDPHTYTGTFSSGRSSDYHFLRREGSQGRDYPFHLRDDCFGNSGPCRRCVENRLRKYPSRSCF